jgi:hypothetical protein
MSETLLVTTTRDGVQKLQNLVVEKHFISESEQHGPYGIRPFYQYLCIAQGIYDIKQNDYMKDQNNTDPITSAPYAYQIVSKPEPFDDGHMEFHANDARITGF